jgi:leucyl-tRNA synthetase
MSENSRRKYDPHTLEAERQAAWSERDAFATPPIAEERPHIYIKASAPFTSGNVHIGHVRSYSIGDAYARFRRARGDDVLLAWGFDAFGLPAELAAISSGEPASDWVNSRARHMTGQLQRLGFSFDWERTFMSSDPIMYRWSQWLFLELLEAGLVYRGTGTVDWCENCHTTLASIQVEPGGTCWRCHGPVKLIELPQWYLRISAYVPENDERSAELQASGIWDEVALASQQIVLGRIDGVELELGDGQGESLTVFTPHTESLSQGRFVLLSARHPAAERWASGAAEELEKLRSGGWQRSSREAETIPFVDTGRTLIGPSGERLPLLITPLVDERFGPTAVLGVPSEDRSDTVIAGRLGIEPDDDGASDEDRPAPDEGAPAQPSDARPAVRYRAYDFTISRQRSWGTPIPIVYCESCGTVPVPREQLPVLLPLDVRPTGTGNPLAEREDFVNTTCPACGGEGRRETDTLDCHFDALWLWVPACVPPQERERSLEEIFALPDLRHWLPSERLVAGSDSGNFVFDQRIVTKALRDIGPLSFLADGEPFSGCLFHEMVIRDGRKMSKHLGNVVDPDELVERYGADTVRLAVLYAARPQRSLNWSDSAVLRCHRFLNSVWDYTHSRLQTFGSPVPGGVPPAGREGGDGGAAADDGTVDAGERDKTEHLRVKLSEWCGNGVKRVTEDMENLEMHSAVRNVMRLFDRIRDFEKRVRQRQPELSAANAEALLEALGALAQVLSPLAPHLGEQLWIDLGHEPPAAQTPWPVVSFRVPA